MVSPNLRIAARDAEPGPSSTPLRNSNSTPSLCVCSSTASEGRGAHAALIPGPLTASTLNLESSFVSDLEARCAHAKQHTNQQLSQLLSLPEMRSEGPELTDEQRRALLALRQLAVTFIEHTDHATASLMCQQLMRAAHELRLPLTGVGDDGINLSTRFVLALTPCARLQPAHHLLSEKDGGEGAAEDDAEVEAEGGEAEAVLQRFYQRWEQSGAAWSHRMIQRRHSAAAPPFVRLSKSLPADSVLFAPSGIGPRSSFALGLPLASSFVGFPATPSGTPKLPRRRQSTPGAETLPTALREASGAPTHAAASLPEVAELSRAPVAELSSPLDRPLDRASLEVYPRSSPSKSSFDLLHESANRKLVDPPTTASPRGTRRSTIAAAPLLLCRICEGMVDADQLEQHSKQCVLEVVVFTAEQRLEKLKDFLTREIEHCAAQGGEAQESPGARQAALLHLLLQTCVEALSFESLDESRSTEMLRDARELQNESHRLADPLLISLAGQLHSVLDQLQPFWREEHGVLHRTASGAHQSLTQAAEAVSINSFEILKPVSRGAYGRVVLAAKKTTGDLFAIKVVRKRDMRRKNQVHRIKVEREVMAEANHPFLVKLFYSFQTAEKLFMVMEVGQEATAHARTQRAQSPAAAFVPTSHIPQPSALRRAVVVCQRR